MEIPFFQVLETARISASIENYKKPFEMSEMSLFSHIFSLLWEFTFPIFWELYELMPHMKYLSDW